MLLKRLPKPVLLTLPVIWAGAILAILTMPSSSLPSVEFWGEDKLAHVGLFFVQMFFVWGALRYGRGLRLTGSKWTVAIIAVTAFGGVTEILQGFTPTRSPDAGDVLADATGALLFLGAHYIYRRMRFTRAGSSSDHRP
ncbi:MAG: hypothetical protein CL946_11285 [Ectothiorhodospiraceae bacterium]|nr:hypothetical protein [Ectothiorhodospiraceae bacterium]